MNSGECSKFSVVVITVYFIMRKIQKNDVVCIVAYDAGAASQIACYVATIPNKIIYSLGGPAISIFQSLFPRIENVSMLVAIAQSDIVICGSGWQSELEWESIKHCRLIGKPIIACIDHWVNYRARFIRNNIECLPDNIWVFDEYARILAEKEFPSVNIIEQPNFYLVSQVKGIEEIDSHQDLMNDSILYLLEPMRESWDGDRQAEFEALDLFTKKLGSLSAKRSVEIILKPHPSDQDGKYDDWLMGHKGLNIKLTRDSLIKAISRATIVVGCRTYAMVVALFAGRRVYSSIPSYVKTQRLPHKTIIELDELGH